MRDARDRWAEPGYAPTCLAVCIRDLGNDLVSAECQQLTGGEPDSSGLASCDSIEQICDAAYLRFGARRIVQTRTLEELVGWLQHARFRATDFRIRLVNLTDKGWKSRQSLIVAVADAIHGRPDLMHPRDQFLLVVSHHACWLGEIAVRAEHSYRLHEAKPYSTAGSLPARLARALVNLVAPEATCILNPCCGSGSILLEARALGLEAHGADWNPRMVGMSRRNLDHFDYAASVELIDAREWTRTGDALIADLPYGTSHPLDEGVMHELLRNAAGLAPLAAIVAAKDISGWLRRSGFCDIEVYRAQKTRGFSRFIHRARSAELSPG